MLKIVALCLEDRDKICLAYGWPLDAKLFLCWRGFYIYYVREYITLIRLPNNLGEAIFNCFEHVTI